MDHNARPARFALLSQAIAVDVVVREPADRPLARFSHQRQVVAVHLAQAAAVNLQEVGQIRAACRHFKPHRVDIRCRCVAGGNDRARRIAHSQAEIRWAINTGGNSRADRHRHRGDECLDAGARRNRHAEKVPVGTCDRVSRQRKSRSAGILSEIRRGGKPIVVRAPIVLAVAGLDVELVVRVATRRQRRHREEEEIAGRGRNGHGTHTVQRGDIDRRPRRITE